MENWDVEKNRYWKDSGKVDREHFYRGNSNRRCQWERNRLEKLKHLLCPPRHSNGIEIEIFCCWMITQCSFTARYHTSHDVPLQWGCFDSSKTSLESNKVFSTWSIQVFDCSIKINLHKIPAVKLWGAKNICFCVYSAILPIYVLCSWTLIWKEEKIMKLQTIQLCLYLLYPLQ